MSGLIYCPDCHGMLLCEDFRVTGNIAGSIEVTGHCDQCGEDVLFGYADELIEKEMDWDDERHREAIETSNVLQKSTPSASTITQVATPKSSFSDQEARIIIARAWIPERMVGNSRVFCRDGHDWSGCEVSILSLQEDGQFRVARCCSICDLLLMGRDISEVDSWVCIMEELM